ncbi:uncharacterized protein KIAA1958 homolog [Argopecten irradians]|uniref:uncharacterized protein KIAA1958 homolog n=1 Tax=Argopecten irradians TaxID=31199 RepID=UPI0037175E94
MAELDEDGLPVVSVGDIIRLVGGQRGAIKAISKKGEQFGFDRYQIQLDSGHILTEPRYKFDVVPSCPGQDPSITTTQSSSFLNTSKSLTMPVSSKLTFCMSKTQTPSSLGLPVHENEDTPDITSDDRDSLDDFDVAGFIDQEVNKNTRKKTDSDVNNLHRYLQNRLNEKRQIQQIPPQHLNKLLCIYFMNVRNQKGEEYEPSSIRGIQCSIDRYLKTKDYGKQLASSIEFKKVMEVIRCKQKKLKREGKGNQPKKAEAISDTDIDKLYKTGQLGTKNPETLLRTVWLLNTVHFGMRGVTEHRDMKWGDVKLCRDTENHEYIEFNESQTKTRPGSNPKNVRAVPPRAWATPENPTRCPVANYKMYKSRRPPTYCNTDDPFYIATNTNTEKSNKWYKCQPVGVNKLGSFMRNMAENAGKHILGQ